MKNTIYSTLLVILLAATGTAVAENNMHGMNHADMQKMSIAPQWVDGQVKKINQKRGKVTLQHGNIPNVMPAMTMSYPVAQRQTIESLNAGDKVRFTLEKNNNDYVVTHIEAVK